MKKYEDIIINMNKFKIFYFIFAIFANTNGFAKNLEFQKILFNRDNSELSGLIHLNSQLLFVADKLSNRAIYKIIFEGNRFYYKEYISLPNLKGHSKYFKDVMLSKSRSHLLHSPFDLEGITYCNDQFYLANEQARDVLVVDKTKMKKLNLPFHKDFKIIDKKLKDISTNAGFEGIAIDCKKQKLFIAQERSPRAIITVDLKTLKVIDIFQTSLITKHNLSPDYADIYFENGFLYMLERNARLISKLNLKTKKIVDYYFYNKIAQFDVNKLYNTGEPYGIAEGLAFSKDQIFIALDNNKKPLSKEAQKKYKLKGKFSSILIFKRPKGF